MPAILHLVTKPQDVLAEEIIRAQGAQPENKLEVVRLGEGEPDYAALVEKIFAADSVQVW